MKIIYLIGPMRSIPLYNFPAFDAARDALVGEGCNVISPADMDRAVGLHPETFPADWDWRDVPDTFDLKATIRRDVEAILSCDLVVMLPGCDLSYGAQAELRIAAWAGAKAVPLSSLVDVPEIAKLPNRLAAAACEREQSLESWQA